VQNSSNASIISVTMVMAGQVAITVNLLVCDENFTARSDLERVGCVLRCPSIAVIVS